MPSTFYQLWNKLIGEVGTDLPVPRAKQIVNQAWRDILNSRPWSFLLRESTIVAPALITGNLTFTQYANTATPDAALKAILDTLVSPPSITRRSIRLATTSGAVAATSPIYDIYGYNSTAPGTITLNRIYMEISQTVSVNIFRRWFLPPYDENGNETADFLRWLTVRDPDNNWWLDLTKPKRYLDQIDPNRTTSSSSPFMLVEGPAATSVYPGVTFDGPLPTGTPLYELYPQFKGTVQKTYLCAYQAHGKEFTDDYGSPTSVLPPYIPEDLLNDKARCYGYRWAEINKGRIPSLQRTNWLELMMMAEASYKENFLEARKIDEEHYKQNWLPKFSRPYAKYPFPFGADYLQTHQWGPYGWGGSA